MTPEQARTFREAWQKAGNPSCDHVSLVLQSTTNGYLTGQYVCTRCGEEICQKNQN
jgi:hypothetical protein